MTNSSHMKSAIFLFVAGQMLLSGFGAAASASADAAPPVLDAGMTTGSRSSGHSLSQVAGQISLLSKIPLLISSDIGDDRVSQAIAAADWKTAIRMLLAEYNHLAIVDRQGRYRRIWLTARRSGLDQGRDFSHLSSPGSLAADGHDEPGTGAELPIALWQPIDNGDPVLPIDSTVPFASVLMDPSFFDALKVGQPIEIPIPQESMPYFGVIGETHYQLNGNIQVWSGPIDGAHDTASFTMTRGRNSTFVTIATGTSIYEAALDNASGVGSVVNEVELTKGKDEQDSLVPSEAEALQENSTP